jgi:hypothetical protein
LCPSRRPPASRHRSGLRSRHEDSTQTRPITIHVTTPPPHAQAAAAHILSQSSEGEAATKGYVLQGFPCSAAETTALESAGIVPDLVVHLDGFPRLGYPEAKVLAVGSSKATAAGEAAFDDVVSRVETLRRFQVNDHDPERRPSSHNVFDSETKPLS